MGYILVDVFQGHWWYKRRCTRYETNKRLESTVIAINASVGQVAANNPIFTTGIKAILWVGFQYWMELPNLTSQIFI
jgi:hypothetical protein